MKRRVILLNGKGGKRAIKWLTAIMCGAVMAIGGITEVEADQTGSLFDSQDEAFMVYDFSVPDLTNMPFWEGQENFVWQPGKGEAEEESGLEQVFTIIPEPSTLVLIIIGVMLMKRRKV